MPEATGQIRFSDYTVFITVPMAELRPGIQMPEQLQDMFDSRASLGLILDPETDAAERVLRLISNSADEFMEHLSEHIPVGTALQGMIVWKGDLILNPDGELLFEGTAERPTVEDLEAYRDMITRMDKVAIAQHREHAKHCSECAKRMGLDPSEVLDDAESEGHDGVWISNEVGEA